MPQAGGQSAAHGQLVRELAQQLESSDQDELDATLDQCVARLQQQDQMAKGMVAHTIHQVGQHLKNNIGFSDDETPPTCIIAAFERAQRILQESDVEADRQGSLLALVALDQACMFGDLDQHQDKQRVLNDVAIPAMTKVCQSKATQEVDATHLKELHIRLNRTSGLIRACAMHQLAVAQAAQGQLEDAHTTFKQAARFFAGQPRNQFVRSFQTDNSKFNGEYRKAKRQAQKAQRAVVRPGAKPVGLSRPVTGARPMRKRMAPPFKTTTKTAPPAKPQTQPVQQQQPQQQQPTPTPTTQEEGEQPQAPTQPRAQLPPPNKPVSKPLSPPTNPTPQQTQPEPQQEPPAESKPQQAVESSSSPPESLEFPAKPKPRAQLPPPNAFPKRPMPSRPQSQKPVQKPVPQPPKQPEPIQAQPQPVPSQPQAPVPSQPEAPQQPKSTPVSPEKLQEPVAVASEPTRETTVSEAAKLPKSPPKPEPHQESQPVPVSPPIQPQPQPPVLSEPEPLPLPLPQSKAVREEPAAQSPPIVEQQEETKPIPEPQTSQQTTQQQTTPQTSTPRPQLSQSPSLSSSDPPAALQQDKAGWLKFIRLKTIDGDYSLAWQKFGDTNSWHHPQLNTALRQALPNKWRCYVRDE